MLSHSDAGHNFDAQMIFEAVAGQPIPLLLRAADGSLRQADGAQYLSLVQAAARFGKSIDALREIYLATWGEFLPVAEPTEAVAPDPIARDEPTTIAVPVRLRAGYRVDDLQTRRPVAIVAACPYRSMGEAHELAIRIAANRSYLAAMVELQVAGMLDMTTLREGRAQ